MNRIAFAYCACLLSAIGAQGQIQPQFFAMGVSTPGDMPKVSYGLIAHPPILWSSVEGTARGTYSFTSIDGFIKKSPKDANGVAQISLDLGGWTPEWAVALHSSCYNN